MCPPAAAGNHAGMTRTAPPPECLTVRELADLLRIKERKVYDLVAAGDVPCSRVTGKLLFPERAIRDWIASASSGPGAASPRPLILLGSHDPLLEWALRQSRCGLATYLDGSLDGLARFRAREGIATGLHVHEGDGGWNRGTVAGAGIADAALVGWARRRRGLVVRPEDAGRIGGIADLRDRRIARRQAESGAQSLFARLAEEAGLDPRTPAGPLARSESDAVQAVAQGHADAAFGLEALAAQFGLHFVPVAEERFDLLVDRRAWFDPPMQVLLEFCAGPDFRNQSAAMPGYDIAELGRVRWNG